MDTNLTHITLLLDASGSMDRLADDTVGTVNQFFAEQRKVPGRMLCTVILFASGRNVVLHRNADISNLSNLTRAQYSCHGNTPLYDAMAQAIQQTGADLAAMPEPSRPGKVIFAVMTDGEENDSREFDSKRVMEMVKKQQSEFSWAFTYLGANQDAIANAAHIGIGPASALNYSASAAGVRSSVMAMSAATVAYRTGPGGQSIMYSAADRSEAMKSH